MSASKNSKTTPLKVAKRIARSKSFKSRAPALHRAYISTLRSFPVWYYGLNRNARKQWRTYPKSLSPLQKELARSLEQDGIAITHIDTLFDTEQMHTLEAYATSLLESKDIQQTIGEKEGKKVGDVTKDDFIVHLCGGYGRENPLFDTSNPFIEWCLNRSILEVVGTYFQMAPKFKMFSLNTTLLMPKTGERVFSQNWHRDSNDIRDTKLFLYLNDVDEGTGPFMYVKGSQLGGRWRKGFGDLGEYPDRAALEEVIPQGDRVVCTGRKGTLVFADTSGLHRGGFSTTKRRLMFTCEFTTLAGLKVPNFSMPDNLDIEQFSPLGRYALEKY